MGTSVGLAPTEFRQLAKIMTGPHGAPPTPDTQADLLVVFSCADPEVGHTAARLHHDHLVRRVVFSGGVGKDSGGLPRLGITEATFLASIAIGDGLPTELIILEQDARNGAENAAFSLQLAAKLGLLPAGARVASLAPATRSRRLYEELRYQAGLGQFDIHSIAGLYAGIADPEDPQVQVELIQELRGLRTMHNGDMPRIYLQPEFQPGGSHWNLSQRADRTN